MNHLGMASPQPPAQGFGCSRFLLWVIIFILFCILAPAFFSNTATSKSAAGMFRCILTSEPGSALTCQKPTKPTKLQEEDQEWRWRLGRRKLMNSRTGPGWSPPPCTSKCGKCRPCKAVHVAVPPGTPVTAEYYPEAWRCKCGNRLFMP